jgi:trans-aconitate 2-methyltransferase
MEKNDWNPDLYLKYGDERTRPTHDLIARINLPHPRRIIDLGCGPGNSTRALAARWPEAAVTGLDNSPAMIDKARAGAAHGPAANIDWRLADAGSFSDAAPFSLVFSCAAIQWIPDHARLLERLFALTADHGALAVQVPRFDDMPLSRAIARAAARPRWAAGMADCDRLFTYHAYPFYYDCLARHTSAIDLWETWYIHVMDSQTALVDWMRATGLRPYLDRLAGADEQQAFAADVLAELEGDYPVRPDGKVLFPFKRLFFIAYRT